MNEYVCVYWMKITNEEHSLKCLNPLEIYLILLRVEIMDDIG
jgi:hypothetical protein